VLLAPPSVSVEAGFTGDQVFAELDEELAAQKSSEEKYFKSYERLHSHRVMLDDRPRTRTYKESLEANKELLKDKIIIDVGAGTGILSIFAARAGARHVYAIEFSETAKMAR
jgi:protein arginine N-methyltransferase 1